MAEPNENLTSRAPGKFSTQMEELRRRIDQLDEELVRLLNARGACANEIGRLKDAAGIDTYQPKREQEVLAHVRGVNTGPLDPSAVTRLFERIIDESRRLERHAHEGDEPQP